MEIPCKYCGKVVVRKAGNRGATCFICKEKKHKEYMKKWNKVRANKNSARAFYLKRKEATSREMTSV